MVCDPNEIKIDVTLSAPFDKAKIVMMRGEWIQCEVRRNSDDRDRELGFYAARRIYVSAEGFPEALFQLLSDLKEPSKLPKWERGALVPGYRSGVPFARKLPPYRNMEGDLCGTCDGTHAHTHQRVECSRCGKKGLGENWPFKCCILGTESP